MGHGGGAAGQQQFERHRAADDVGGADDHGMQAVQVDSGAVQQGHDAFRRAGLQYRHALGQAADVERVEAVDILVRVDALEQLRGIQMGGQWQLHQDAVDGRIGVESVDQAEQFFLRGAGVEVVGLGDEADFLAVLALVGDVNLGGWIAADQNDGQPGNAQTLLAALGYALGDLLAEAGGDGFTVDQLCGHDAWRTVRVS
ncbi:hypothetical protein D3C78_1108110 [compost metagenome]